MPEDFHKKIHTPIHTSRKVVESMRKKADQQRSVTEKLADWLTDQLGSIWFLVVNLFGFIIWILLNGEWIPGFTPIDPFPFNFLTMTVSLEAIFLSIIVLVSQNRIGKVDELREEIDLQVDMITERELTKLMRIAVLLAEKNNINLSQDTILAHMLKKTDTGKIEEELREQIF